jgi:hypothetical protein
MPETRRYVPVLRWKAGERTALGALAEETKSRITPLLEFPQVLFKPTKSNPTPQSVVPNLVADIAGAWGVRPVFCDLNMLSTFPGSSIHPLGLLGDRCHALGVQMIPVVPFTSDDLAYRQAVTAMVAARPWMRDSSHCRTTSVVVVVGTI